MKGRQLNFLMTGTGRDSADKNPFLVALAAELPGVSVFQHKNTMGTLESNLLGARRQLRAAVKANDPTRVVLVGHSEGGIHAMRLAKEPCVRLAVACATPICTHVEIARYQFECRGAVAPKFRRILNSQPYASPSKKPGAKDRDTVLKMFAALGWPAAPDHVDYTVSLLNFDGRAFVPDEGREKIVFAFSKHDMNIPSEVSISNLRKIDPTMPIRMLCATDHDFRTKRRRVSRTAVRQVVALTRPNKSTDH